MEDWELEARSWIKVFNYKRLKTWENVTLTRRVGYKDHCCTTWYVKGLNLTKVAWDSAS